jgi:superfamily II DNA helicase RecQ
MNEFGVKAVSVNAKTLAAASREGWNLLGKICDCQWSIVILSAERLTLKDVDHIVCNEKFCTNLIALGIDEAHILVPWGKDFWPAYHQIALLHKRLPDHVVLVAGTATLALGHNHNALCAALGLKEGKYHAIQFSSEQPNVRQSFASSGMGLMDVNFQTLLGSLGLKSRL